MDTVSSSSPVRGRDHGDGDRQSIHLRGPHPRPDQWEVRRTRGPHGGTLCHLRASRFPWGVPFDHEVLWKQVATGTYDGLIICHNETSTGITQDAEAIAVMCKEHDVPFLVDGITSVGGLPVHPEAWSVEAVVMGAQKCTAGPSGIAALAVSPTYLDRMVTRKEGEHPATTSICPRH